MNGARPLAALSLTLVLAACGRPPAPQGSTPVPGTVENAAPPSPPAPGSGYLKLRTIYDYVGDRSGTPWEPFEANGEYNYPEPIIGGWPIFVTPVDEAGSPTGPTVEITTLQELSPTDGRYVELPAGSYRLEERQPASTSGGGVWSVTGANSTQGETTTPAGAVALQLVTVAAGQTTVARFFNVCRVEGVAQVFPKGAQENINTFGWVCKPDFEAPPIGAPGSLDASFGVEGQVVTGFGGAPGTALAAALQPDGKVLAVGTVRNSDNDDFALVRYNPDGSLDTSFGADGLVVTGFSPSDDAAEDVAVQPDGKIVAAGRASGFNQFVLARYNADGSLDTSFGSGGKVVTSFSSGSDFNTFAEAVVVQPDGKIVAGGRTTPSTEVLFALARYNPDGSLDSSFDGDGRVTTAFGGRAAAVSDLAVQPDGKVVAGGSFSGGGSEVNFALARYNPDGSLDSSFSGEGTVTDNLGAVESIEAIALQPDGLIVAVGNVTSSDFSTSLGSVVVRYNVDGSRDASFGGGQVRLPDLSYDVALQGDGRVVVAGSAEVGSGFDFAISRINADGTPDASFGVGGTATTDLGGSSDLAYAVVLQADGRIVAAGSTTAGGVASFALARYFP